MRIEYIRTVTRVYHSLTSERIFVFCVRGMIHSPHPEPDTRDIMNEWKVIIGFGDRLLIIPAADEKLPIL